MKLLKIQHRGLQILWVIILSVIFIGFFKIVRGEDQETFENRGWLIRQEPNQSEVRAEALEDFETPAEPPKSPMDRRREWAEKAAGAEKVTGQEADEVAPKAAIAPGKVQTIDLHLEEDRQHKGDIHFNIPGTDTTIKISGFAVGSIIHDFDAIDSPSEFITSKIVVDGDPTGVSDSGTRFTAQQSRFIAGSKTPTKIGNLSALLSVDFFDDPDSTSLDPRLRQAWGQLDDFFFGGSLRVGRSWSTWDDVPGIPETLDFQGPNGSQQTRHNLVGWGRDFHDNYFLRVAVDIDNRDVEPGNALNRTLYAAGNLIWSPVKQVDIGVEVLWGQRKNKDGSDGDTKRFQCNIRYNF